LSLEYTHDFSFTPWSLKSAAAPALWTWEAAVDLATGEFPNALFVTGEWSNCLGSAMMAVRTLLLQHCGNAYACGTGFAGVFPAQTTPPRQRSSRQ
jgi:hypothetical protein